MDPEWEIEFLTNFSPVTDRAGARYSTATSPPFLHESNQVKANGLLFFELDTIIPYKCAKRKYLHNTHS